MKINIVPLNKLALISAAVCAVMLAFSHNASANRIVGGINIPTTALTFNDTHVVGTISPAAPASPADVAPYINFMIGLVPGHSGTFHNPPHTQTVTRSSNLFPSLPNALVPGAVSGWYRYNYKSWRRRCIFIPLCEIRRSKRYFSSLVRR